MTEEYTSSGIETGVQATLSSVGTLAFQESSSSHRTATYWEADGDGVTLTEGSGASEGARPMTSAIEHINELAHRHHARMTDALDSIEARESQARYWCLSDPIALFLLRRIVDADGMRINEADEIIANGKGWSRIIMMVQARLIDLAGEYLRPLNRAEALLKQAERVLTAPVDD